MNIKKLKELASELDNKAHVYFYTTKGKTHCEIRMIDKGIVANRGYKIERIGDKVHNSELFSHVVETILYDFFKIDEKGKIKLVFGEKIYENYGFKFESKKLKRSVKFLFNKEVVFTSKLSQTYINGNNKLSITQKAILKAIDEIEKYLKNIFFTTQEDFKLCRNLIGAVDTYLLEK